MLIRFGVRNLLSFDQYQELSFVASSLKDAGPEEVAIRKAGKVEILPVLVLYGANASGKTNALLALDWMRDFVIHSHTGRSDEKVVRYERFRLAPDDETRPSQVDCDFVLNGVRHHYGFEFARVGILREWLYAYPGGRRNVLFVRNTTEDSIYFGPAFAEKAKGRVVEKIVRGTSLFVSAGSQNNLALCDRIKDWFASQIVSLRWHPGAQEGGVFDEALEDADLRERIVDFLQGADPTIVGIKKVREGADPKVVDLLNHIDEYLRQDESASTDRGIPAAEFAARLKEYSLVHRGEAGEIPFPIRLESQGTLKLLGILGSVFRCLSNGALLLCDEIESSLHPLLAAKIIAFFNDATSNTAGAQLLTATHDTNLLDLKCFRRDQIWFAEKSSLGATIVYSLAELSVRREDNIKRGYLQGRFGAIPFLPSADHLCGPPRKPD